MDAKAKQSLKKLMPHQAIIDPAEMIPYERDAGFDRGTPASVVLPQSREDVVRVVRWANEHDIALVARGAGTGLSGGAVAERGGVIVGFARMNRVIELDAPGHGAVVEPGMLNLALDELVRKRGLYFPPDPSSQRASTLGGNVAENAGGPHCFKYGVTTNYVTGLEIVLADGQIVQLGGRALDYPEYDFVGLVVGSEGTLALVTQIAVRLLRYPPGVKTMMASFDSVEQCGVAVSAVIAAGIVPATMELMDRNFVRAVEEHAHAGLPTDAGAVLIVEVDGYPASLNSQIDKVERILREYGGRGMRIARDATEREQIWYARKSAAGAFARLALAYYLVDITVPRSRLAETLEQSNRICNRYGVRVQYVLHAGDGNLHPVILIPNPNDPHLLETVHRAAQEIIELGIRENGSLTGEHGVGIEKRSFMPLMFNAAELTAMWDVKQVFDPHQRLNPGKIFPESMPTVETARGDADLPEAIFAPASIDQAARGLAALTAKRRRVHIGGTPHLSQDSVWLSTERLTGIKTYAPDDLYVTVGAGTRLADLQKFLARDNNQAPIVSPWQDASIGGIVAENINAPLRMRYGSLRNLVLAMTVVLADGRVIRVGRPVVKNVAGYDLPKIFVGSRGTLGLIVDVTLKIMPLPRARRTLTIACDDPGHLGGLARGLDYAAKVLPLALVASAIVLVKNENGFLFAYTAEGLAEDVEAELEEVQRALQSAGATMNEVEMPTGTDLWSGLLRNATESELVVRVAVAPKDLADFARSNEALFAAGKFLVDVANGFIYAVMRLDLVARSREWVELLRRAAQNREGYAVVMRAPNAAGDHIDWWGHRPELYDLMQKIKARWDPAGILDS